MALGRVHLLRAVQDVSGLATSHPICELLNTALAKLRESNNNYLLPRALLPCAWMHALAGQWDTAQQRLDEAYTLATRSGNAANGWLGGMRLHIIDTLLYRARLFGRRNEYPWEERTPQSDLAEAAQLIWVCDYHRRDLELDDAKAAFGG